MNSLKNRGIPYSLLAMEPNHPKLVTWIWRHITMALPPDWEMLQFSTEFTRGRCAFADRHQFRAEVSWRTVRGEPDYQRMVNDYVHRLEHEKKLTESERSRRAGWHGFYGRIQGAQTSRFGRYLPEVGCLVETVFLWPEQRDAALEGALLGAIHTIPPDDHQQKWRAFGMEVQAPRASAIEGCVVQPARAEFSFTNPKTGNMWQFGRLGMVPSWYDGDLETWLKRSLGDAVREARYIHRTVQGADRVYAEGTFKPKSIHWGKGKFEAVAWVHPEDGRLYFGKQWLRRPESGAALEWTDRFRAAPEFTPVWRHDTITENRNKR